MTFVNWHNADGQVAFSWLLTNPDSQIWLYRSSEQKKNHISTVAQSSLGVIYTTASVWYICRLFSNWGSESDESQSYHNGNSDPRGFGKFVQTKDVRGLKIHKN